VEDHQRLMGNEAAGVSHSSDAVLSAERHAHEHDQ
jgi:hypothetical protein